MGPSRASGRSTSAMAESAVIGSGIGLDLAPFQSYIGASLTMKHDVIGSPPLVREIVYGEPARLARRLRHARHLTLLESVLRQEHLGRYSFLACDPTATLTARDGMAYLDGEVQEEPALHVLDRMLAEPPGLFLRDFHSPNLFWLPDRPAPRNVGVIDFQDARLGPDTYDLVSLLRDSYVDFTEQQVEELIAFFLALRHPKS